MHGARIGRPEHFYPRSPCGERRYIWPAYLQRQIISIHALLAESDDAGVHHIRYHNDFYPRSPCGERRGPRWTECRHPPFLSTLSLRRATEYWVGGYGTANNFYPRSPCGERLVLLFPQISVSYFYPRSPCGERRFTISAHCFDGWISIHALLAESDRNHYNYDRNTHISIHALLAESDYRQQNGPLRHS